jgi:hypothetical protein
MVNHLIFENNNSRFLLARGAILVFFQGVQVIKEANFFPPSGQHL